MTVYAVLPAYNEAESLPNLLGRFAELPSEFLADLVVCVVDDGSADDTVAVAKAATGPLNLTILQHEQNRGLGQAVQTGIRHVVATGSDDDKMVIMDADDTHDPRTVIKLVDAIDQGADIAIASRFADGGDDSTAPYFRRLLSRGAAVVFRAALPIDRRVQDFTSGFRGYRVSVLKRVTEHWGERLIEERGFACMVELLLKLRFCKPNIVEVPFYLEYDRKGGASKIRIFRTILQYMKLAVRDRVSPPPYRDL